MSSSDTETDIEGQIKAKGDEIRAMKESGADKKSVAPFVEELLALKAKLEVAEIEDQIQAKGDEIRAMKESGADKNTVAPFVEELLALKAKLEPPSDKKEKKRPVVANKDKKFTAPTSSTADLLPMINTDSDGKILKRVKTANASPTDGDISIKGWVRTVRKQKTLAFVEVNDGSSLSGIQCVLPFDDLDKDSKSGRFFVGFSMLKIFVKV